MTAEALFRYEPYLKECEAIVTASTDQGLRFDRTVFYPIGGGQPGDQGYVEWDGSRIPITDTRKWRCEGSDDDVLHVVGMGPLPAVGQKVRLELDWERRFAHMRMHTCLHLLSALFRDAAVTGGQVGRDKSRLDFDLPAGMHPDKEQITRDLNELISAGHDVRDLWITEEELAAQPELIRTMSVKPPSGAGRVRLLSIGGGIDLQPCGGTHVKNTAEIGPVEVIKIENKGKQNRRVIVILKE